MNLTATSAKASAPQIYRCSFPGCPVPVSIQISLIETLRRIVRAESGDRQGIIYGQPSAVGTVAVSSRAVTVFGMEEMRRAIAEAHDPVVGYYRIREGNSLELTTDEINLGVTLFAKPGSVILLIERRAGYPEANFFFLEHGAFLNLPLLEFPLDAAALTERELERASRTGEEAVVPADQEPAPPSSGSSSPRSAANGKPASAGRLATSLWVFAIVILAVAASFSAALFIYRPHNQSSNAAATRNTVEARAPLRAERQGEDLKIMWDLTSPAVASATSGVLDINDGDAARQIPMTADQVRFGSLLYTPVSEQVSVRLTTLKDNQSTQQESVLVLLRKPPQPQSSSNGRQSPHVPFEVKTERMASTRALVPPAGNREIKPPVQPESQAARQASPQRVDLPAPAPLGSVSTPAIATLRSEPAKPAIQASWERVDLPAPAPLGSVAPPAIATLRSEPAKPAMQASPQRADLPTPLSAGSAPLSAGSAPLSAGSAPLSAGSAPAPPDIAVRRSEPVKPAMQASPQRADLPAPLPLGSVAAPPAIAAPQSEPAKSREGYVAPVLISQAGVQTPRELLPILTRAVAVSVRVDVNEAGRVTRAEAIAEKGIHALLLRAATDAALRCRFQPARQGQSPVSSNVTIVFHIGPE